MSITTNLWCEGLDRIKEYFWLLTLSLHKMMFVASIKNTSQYEQKAGVLLEMQFPDCMWTNLPAEPYLRLMMLLWRPASCLWVILQWCAPTVGYFLLPVMSCCSCKLIRLWCSLRMHESPVSLIKLLSSLSTITETPPPITSCFLSLFFHALVIFMVIDGKYCSNLQT